MQWTMNIIYYFYIILIFLCFLQSDIFEQEKRVVLTMQTRKKKTYVVCKCNHGSSLCYSSDSLK